MTRHTDQSIVVSSYQIVIFHKVVGNSKLPRYKTATRVTTCYRPPGHRDTKPIEPAQPTPRFFLARYKTNRASTCYHPFTPRHLFLVYSLLHREHEWFTRPILTYTQHITYYGLAKPLLIRPTWLPNSRRSQVTIRVQHYSLRSFTLP